MVFKNSVFSGEQKVTFSTFTVVVPGQSANLQTKASLVCFPLVSAEHGENLSLGLCGHFYLHCSFGVKNSFVSTVLV